MVSVKIDNVSVNVESGLEFIVDGGEEFNLGILKLVNTSRREPYPDYADVEITVNSKVYEACIQNDLSKRTSIGVYNHDIVLAEPVIKLSQYIHADRKYTTWDGNQITYLDQIDNLLSTIDLDKTNPFTVSSAAHGLLNTPAIEKEYSGGDLLTTLTDMFRSVNAVPTLSLDNEISYERFGKQGNEITIVDIIAESITSDIGDYGLAVHSKVKSGTYESSGLTGGTYIPSQGYGITPRSSNDKYDDDDAQWFLYSGVRRVIKAQILNLDSQSAGTVTANISAWVVSEAEWNNLETETDAATLYAGKYKNNTIYIAEGDSIVQNAGVKTKNSVALITGDTAMESLIHSYWGSIGSSSQYKAQNLSGIAIEWLCDLLIDFDVRVERHNIDRVGKNATVMNNQKDSIIELQRYGTALKSHINRIGNDTFEVSIRYSDLVAFITWDINDYTSDGYKIVKIKFLTRDNSLDVTYSFTKNQSILNPQTSVNRKVSPFTISRRNILTCFTYNEYVEFSSVIKTNTSNLTDAGIAIMFNNIKYTAANNTPVHVGQYFSASGHPVLINMSVMKAPMGQTLAFNVQFKEPRVAGYQLVADGILGHKLRPINYADENGQVDEFSLRLGTVNIVGADTHPVGASGMTTLMSIDTTRIELNPDEIFGVTVHQHLITDRSNLIIGDYFTENNSLVKIISGSATLVYYDGNANHNIYDKVETATPVGTGSYTVVPGYGGIIISGVPTGSSWAIVDVTTRDIYLAYNNIDGTDMNTVLINRLKERPNIEVL